MIKLRELMVEGKMKVDRDELNMVNRQVVDLLRIMEEIDMGEGEQSIELGLHGYIDKADEAEEEYYEVDDYPVKMTITLNLYGNSYNGTIDDREPTDSIVEIYLPKSAYKIEGIEDKLRQIMTHEYLHYVQAIRSYYLKNGVVSHSKRNISYGLEKKKLLSKVYNPSGYSKMTGRRSQHHDLQSIEFKPLLDTFLDGFNQLVYGIKDVRVKKILFLFYIGNYDEEDANIDRIRKEYSKEVNDVQYNEMRTRLLYIKLNDKNRWGQLVKEMVKELF